VKEQVLEETPVMRCMPSLASLVLGLGLFSPGASALLAGPALLKQSEAELRTKQVSDVSYALDLDLPETDTPFQGTVRIRFTFTPQNQPLRVDFAKGKVETVKVNGKTVKFEADDMALRLNENVLQANAKNELEIRYEHPYSKDGNGLYWFKDPVDQQVYTYTHFEPYAANMLFPSFDQPDLKATYQLKVKAPKSWTVVSTTRESKVTPDGEKNVWEFPETLKFSTYLFSLHAGPYRVWEDKSFRYPLRIMARQSLAQYMPVDQWFKATRHGFDFLDKYMGYVYPFGKYDQVVVPDFNAGAMENVAAVTFSERFLVRGKRTEADEQGLAGTIQHEMAHMWSGNLVTMQWWNDLWLNESFATYAATLTMAADPRFPSTWIGFHRSKTGAYYQDQLVTTHPIVADVPDTMSTNFDGITYGKGASFLKQLHFLVGEKAFQKGLQIYFNQHAFGNTEVNDFIAAMEKSTGRSLQAFAKEWLTTAGVNTLAVDFTCSKGKIDQFQLKQSAIPEQPTLREHKTQVALYKWKNKRFELIKEAAVGYQSPVTTWKEAKGLACPDLVFPNQNDHDYVKVVLDPVSYKNAAAHLQAIQSPMQRIMVWNAVSDMILTTDISLKDYTRFVVQQLPLEKDYEVLRAIDGKIGRDLLGYVEWISEKTVKQDILNELIQAYEGTLKSSLPSDSKKVQWGTYRQLLTIAGRTDGLLSLWNGKTSFPGVVIDQDERWGLLEALSDLGHKEVLGWADAEKQKDPTSMGQRRYLAVKASFPDYDQKMKMLEPIVKGERMSGAERYAIMGNLFPAMQRDLLKRYEPTYRQQVDSIVSKAEPGVARSYVMSLLPMSCDNSTMPLIDELLAKPYPQSINDGLKVAKQNNERCQKVMTRLLSSRQG
jgi:aminopeptidase N